MMPLYKKETFKSGRLAGAYLMEFLLEMNTDTSFMVLRPRTDHYVLHALIGICCILCDSISPQSTTAMRNLSPCLAAH